MKTRRIAALDATLVTAALLVATSLDAQQTRPVELPRGENLTDRPEQPTDITLSIDRNGAYYLNAKPIPDDQLAAQLAAITKAQAGDKILYVRADGSLNYSRVLIANDLAARAGVCVAAVVGEQQPGTVSHVLADQNPANPPGRRAIDVQLPDPSAPSPGGSGNKDYIVLEVLPGPTYRINTTPVSALALPARLAEIYHARPQRVLFVKGDPAARFQDVLGSMAAARGAGVIVINAASSDLPIPGVLPAIDLTQPVTDARKTRAEIAQIRCRRQGPPSNMAASPATGGLDTTQTYFTFQLEKEARPIAGTGTVKYPEVLRASNVEGEVRAQFVVGTDGRVMRETFKVLKSTNELFTQAVRNALPDMRFTPGEINGTRVRALVEQSFPFSPR